jgi:cold shock CspA family protein
LAERNCGFILTANGAEIYFHRNSVANGGFDRLAVGDEVRFAASIPRAPKARRRVPWCRSASTISRRPMPFVREYRL